MSTHSVQTGFWVDHSRGGLREWQILCSDHWAGILTNTLAVLITSVGGPIFELFGRPVLRYWKKTSSRWIPVQPTTLQDAHDFTEMATEMLEQIARNLPRNGYVNVPLGVPTSPNGQSAAADAFGAAAMVIIALGLPVFLITASIISAGLGTDTFATSKAPLCGRYIYNSIARNSSALLEFEHKAESQAGVYAEDCYGSSPLVVNCNKFYNQTISYSFNSTFECPFDGKVCDGVNDSTQVTTGLLPASVLGINTAKPLLFSRTMACSPLAVGPEYVSIGVSDQGQEQWEYWYGRSLASYTWANPVQESAWEIKGYSTGVHCSEPGAADAAFAPFPQFRAGPFPVTISFISSHTIFYPEFRDDPVFPARQKAHFPPEYRGPTLYYNNSTRAGVLGCVDQSRICRTAKGPCWDNGNITSIFDDRVGETVTEEQNVALLLLLSLDYSTSCGSIQFRGAEALDAQSKVAHMQSLPLAEKQWQVEVEKMFQTSLARMQLNVFDVFRGTASSFDGYEDTLPAKYRGICHLVKIPTVGWRNINFVGVIGVVITVLCFWGLSWKRKTGSGSKTLIAVLLWENVLKKPCIGIGKAIIKVLGWIVSGLKLGVDKLGPPLWTGLKFFIFDPLRLVLMSL